MKYFIQLRNVFKVHNGTHFALVLITVATLCTPWVTMTASIGNHQTWHRASAVDSWLLTVVCGLRVAWGSVGIREAGVWRWWNVKLCECLNGDLHGFQLFSQTLTIQLRLRNDVDLNHNSINIKTYLLRQPEQSSASALQNMKGNLYKVNAKKTKKIVSLLIIYQRTLSWLI